VVQNKAEFFDLFIATLKSLFISSNTFSSSLGYSQSTKSTESEIFFSSKVSFNFDFLSSVS